MELNVAMLLFDLADNLELSCRMVRVARSLEKKHEMLGDVTSTEVDSLSRVCNRESLIDGTGMGAAITNIKHNTCCQSTCVE